MPLYEYLCQECAIKFEKIAPASSTPGSHPCPKCKLPASQVPSLASPTFIGEAPEKISTTGLSSLDNNFDRLIGEDSVKKWEIISAREKEKLKILNENAEVSRSDLKKMEDGSYSIMPKSESESFKQEFFKLKLNK